MAASALRVRLIGELAVFDGSRVLPLPASRKARALFLFLLLSNVPVRRERLCELLFPIPNDPRAALRWCLTKIRTMLGDQAGLLHAERETVALDAAGFVSDLEEFEDLLTGTVAADRADARPRLQLLLEEPLAGLHIPRLDRFALWLRAEQSRLDRLRAKLLRRAVEDLDLTAGEREHLRQEAERLDAEETGAAAASRPPSHFLSGQTMRYCRTRDGTRIAYACTGEGPPLVKAANWLNHLELDWESPVWGRLLTELSAQHTLVRYDERGNGCSDWNVADLGFEAFVRDLEAVVDHLELERFPLFGMSQGCAVSIEYARRHPEKVSHLILLGGYAVGWRHVADPVLRAQREAIITLARTGWGEDNPVYRQLFSQTFMPSASHEVIDWFNEFQRETTSAANAARFLETFADIDVRASLAEVRTPTLVLHARGDQRVPVEYGMDLASGILGASFVLLDTPNHILLADEPATNKVLDCIHAFLARPAGPGISGTQDGLLGAAKARSRGFD